MRLSIKIARKINWVQNLSLCYRDNYTITQPPEDSDLTLSVTCSHYWTLPDFVKQSVRAKY